MDEDLTLFFYPEDSIPVEERVECSLYERWETVTEVRPFNCGLD